jgi:predicted AlkP superfamily phosphohydrolase/phosphomutase
VLTAEQFLRQVQLTMATMRRLHRHLQAEHREGLLFIYYGTLDQASHMLWHFADPEHPLHLPGHPLRDALADLYAAADSVLGEVQAALPPDATLVIMSDHGFAPFSWGVNLNTWLLEQGYVGLRDPAAQTQGGLFANVDWRRTRAYAMGLNGLYVNLEGRESAGIVSPGAEQEALLSDLEAKLLAMVDPRTGRHPVSRVTRPVRDLHGPYVGEGPDLLVGYSRGYRSSWENPLGEFPAAVFVDNTLPWSGDHCVDPAVVPGVLLSNRRILLPDPALHDLTVALLDEYGVRPPAELRGRDCLAGPTPAATGNDP